jgi:tetratricopeptide (TPR) repeat protein
MRDLLKEGETALNSNENAKARAAFEKVLSEHDRSSGAALYGLGLIASREGDSTQAREYFERATRAENIENSMKVWAYVYLARILDLQCERERAVENYRQAVKLGDNTRNAQSAAQEGIKKPYGDACGVRK